jgi:GxxExxY protein
MKEKLIYKELSGSVIGAFYAVYNALGYGFLENVYANALSLDLRTRGLSVKREAPTHVYYLGQPVALFKLDMLVEERVVVEIKTAKLLAEADQKQLFNYLRSTDLQIGLLLNFGFQASLSKGGIDQ